MKIKNIIIGIIVALMLTSCGTEFSLAKKFVGQSSDMQVAVYFPEEAKVTLIQDNDGTYTQVLDSLNQDVFLDVMYAAYADELGRYKVNVYIPDDPDAVQVDSTHWLVLLSQVEIQGLFTDYVDELFDFTDEYAYTFPLNTVNVASWFDVNDGEWRPTLFDEYNLTDDFDSHVAFSREGLQYYYNITPLKIKDVYDFAVFLGKRYAAFTYDYMMNRYVEVEMGAKSLAPRFRLRWDPYEGSFYFQQEDEGFIELKEGN
jgi:hypothetical protein